MNRMSRVYTSLSYFLILLAIVCTPVVGRSATTVATPTFSLAAGSYTGVQSATISDGTSGASCYYTLTAGTTGTTPTTSSTKYSSAISVTATSVLEALCAYSGDTNFAVASATRTYTYGLQRISENLSPALTGSNVWTPSFYVYDGAGSVRQLTNSAGVVTDEYEYDAYGNSFTKQGTTPNNYLYRGEQYDPDLGLYYLRARYYNPATGRFLSRDPLDGQAKDPASLHKYLYAGGNPINASDPTGRYYEYDATLVADTIKDILAIRRVQIAVCGAIALIGGGIAKAWDMDYWVGGGLALACGILLG